MHQVFNDPWAARTVAGGLNPKPGQAAAGREDVADELELGVGLLSCNTRAPQPGPYGGPGELQPPDSDLGEQGVSMNAA